MGAQGARCEGQVRDSRLPCRDGAVFPMAAGGSPGEAPATGQLSEVKAKKPAWKNSATQLGRGGGGMAMRPSPHLKSAFSGDHPLPVGLATSPELGFAVTDRTLPTPTPSFNLFYPDKGRLPSSWPASPGVPL